MNNVKPGLKVVVIGDNNQIRKGTVKEVYDCVAIAIVEFNDGSVEKVPYKLIGIDPFPTYDNREPVEEPIEQAPDKSVEEKPKFKDEITITHKDFKEKLSGIIAHEIAYNDLDPFLGLMFTTFGALLIKELFLVESEND